MFSVCSHNVMSAFPEHNIVRIWCSCGHEGLADLGRFIHRDEVLRRARCSVCGKKGAMTLIKPTYHPKAGCDPFADLKKQRQERGW